MNIKIFRAGSRIDKDSMPCNKPRKSPNPDKKKVVKGCEGGKEKILHFGATGYSDYTKHKDSGRRSNFRARHNCDTAKSKLTARHWACKTLWRNGGVMFFQQGGIAPINNETYQQYVARTGEPITEQYFNTISKQVDKANIEKAKAFQAPTKKQATVAYTRITTPIVKHVLERNKFLPDVIADSTETVGPKIRDAQQFVRNFVEKGLKGAVDKSQFASSFDMTTKYLVSKNIPDSYGLYNLSNNTIALNIGNYTPNTIAHEIAHSLHLQNKTPMSRQQAKSNTDTRLKNIGSAYSLYTDSLSGVTKRNQEIEPALNELTNQIVSLYHSPEYKSNQYATHLKILKLENEQAKLKDYANAMSPKIDYSLAKYYLKDNYTLSDDELFARFTAAFYDAYKEGKYDYNKPLTVEVMKEIKSDELDAIYPTPELKYKAALELFSIPKKKNGGVLSMLTININ